MRLLYHIQQEMAEGKPKLYVILQQVNQKADTKQVQEQTQPIFLLSKKKSEIYTGYSKIKQLLQEDFTRRVPQQKSSSP